MQSRILIADDDPLVRDAVAKILELFGHNVTAVADGQEVLEKLQSEIDIIILDINMPGMDGYEVTKRLREMPKLAHVPIIALTANVLRGDREKSLDAGCDGYIQKPLDVDMLPEQVATFLSQACNA